MVTVWGKDMPYSELSINELETELIEAKKEYEHLKGLNLNINMSRGQPCQE